MKTGKISEHAGFSLIALISAAALILTFLNEPIAQDLSYHQFIDSRSLIGIPNFLNVTSNAAFLLVGILGLYKLLVSASLQISTDFKAAYLLLFAALILVAFGSAYYHLSPDNLTLAWDRVPMAIGFMSLFCIIIYEFISPRYAKLFLFPAVLAGITSVIYWSLTENHAAGDLRFYILVQFLPVLLTPVILIFFRSTYNRTGAYWWLLFAYLLAKLFELYDSEIFSYTGFISGHSLKHLSAALGFYLLLNSYETRQIKSRRE